MLAKGKKNAGGKNQPAFETIQPMNDQATNIDIFLLNPNIELPPENIILTIQGKTVLSTKNVSVISGKPKSRKSVVAHSIIGSAISGRSVLGFETKIQNNVVLIDTEQSHHDLLRSLNRMKSLCSMEIIPEKLKVYSVRQLNVQQIQSLLKLLCEDVNNELIIIDGALDLINNMNDVEETKAIIDLIKKILVEHNVALIMIIHQSKTTNFTIGHFGSYFDRFSQSVIDVTKLENGNSKISSAMMRSDGDFKPFEFYWNYNINNYTLDWTEPENMLLNKPEDWNDDKHKEKLTKIFDSQPSYNYTQLVAACKKEYEKSEYFSKNLIKYLFERELIVKDDKQIILKSQIPF